MCREHLQLLSHFGADCLVDYYVGMRSGNASAWLVFELDTYTRRRVLETDIDEFCRYLTARLKRSEAAPIEELCGARHTPPIAEKDITLDLWAQCKAGIAKQLGYTAKSSITKTIYILINVGVPYLLPCPGDDTRLNDFIRQREDRRPAVETLLTGWPPPYRNEDRPVNTIVATDETSDETIDAMTGVGDCCDDRPKPRCDDQRRDDRRRYDDNLTATTTETTTVVVTHATGTTHATMTVIALSTGSMFFAITNTTYVEKKCLVIEESDHDHSAADEGGCDSESAASKAPVQSQQ
ncbi:hypothetical protein FDECE_2882 [Fusarium decemcellulare]|nr:hypothetical protein FDECE_2882 [Fusarium decemcellulare]